MEVKALQAAGKLDEARERFTELVTRHQRRASRIAFHYVRDAADADEAVQDAFVKAYSHIGTFREELPFEVWFTRILINGCLDRIKARKRREKWIAPPTIDPSGVERNPAEFLPSRGPSPEESGIAAGTPAPVARGARPVAGTAAAGVHAEPVRRPDVARGQWPHGPERIDCSRAFVPRHPAAAGIAHGWAGRRESASGRRVNRAAH